MNWLCKSCATWSCLCIFFALGLAPDMARAFCGFYVTGADTSLYANATMVVLMRDGTRTVLSMQNNYQGPPEAFALIIPVPTVLQQEQVKTLPRDIFTRVDQLSAPRLVEYWEEDPCLERGGDEETASASGPVPTSARGAPAVTVEARFAVGEYDVEILSATDSTGLEQWLKDNQYNIPSGAGDVLAPYVAQGTKFFAAKVDPSRVSFEGGQALLSPLRFYYDTPDFNLPVRLGLLNSQGTQDLIVNILASSRYELANYPNVLIPTNIRVHDEVRDSFGSFYEALFQGVLDKNPGSIVTEYAWSASSCDPCPTPPLAPGDLASLGADVTRTGSSSGGRVSVSSDYVLTRLHYRYTRESLGDDLVFKRAPALLGGRGMPDNQGKLEPVTQTDSDGFNNFQGRYVILHPWQTKLDCGSPMRGYWGESSPSRSTGTQPAALTAQNTALKGAPASAGDLSVLVAESVESAGVTAKRPVPPLGTADITSTCACHITGVGRPAGLALGGVLGASLLFGARSLRRRSGARR